MTKYKSRAYSEVKAFRSQLTRHLAGKPVRAAGPGAGLVRAYLDREAAEGPGLIEGFMVGGLIGPVVNVPALVAALRGAAR